MVFEWHAPCDLSRSCISSLVADVSMRCARCVQLCVLISPSRQCFSFCLPRCLPMHLSSILNVLMSLPSLNFNLLVYLSATHFFQILFRLRSGGTDEAHLLRLSCALTTAFKQLKRHAETNRAKEMFACLVSEAPKLECWQFWSPAKLGFEYLDLTCVVLKFEAHEIFHTEDITVSYCSCCWIRCGIHFQGLKCAIPKAF